MVTYPGPVLAHGIPEGLLYGSFAVAVVATLVLGVFGLLQAKPAGKLRSIWNGIVWLVLFPIAVAPVLTVCFVVLVLVVIKCIVDVSRMF